MSKKTPEEKLQRAAKARGEVIRRRAEWHATKAQGMGHEERISELKRLRKEQNQVMADVDGHAVEAHNRYARD